MRSQLWWRACGFWAAHDRDLVLLHGTPAFADIAAERFSALPHTKRSRWMARAAGMLKAPNQLDHNRWRRT